LDFGSAMAGIAAGFVGVDWLESELDSWLAQEGQRALILLGEPGSGKTTTAAWLALHRPEVVAFYRCSRRQAVTTDPHQFVASLVAQLHTRLPGFAQALALREPGSRRGRA